MKGIRTGVIALIAATACIVCAGCADDYEPRIICHNANCLEPANPEADSTMESLAASLEYLDEETGRPVVDGVEIDTFWWGAQERCLMAHDLNHPDRATDTTDAAQLINDILAGRVDRGEALTRSAGRYTVLIELKGHVAEAKDTAHNAEQRQQHAACGIELGEMIVGQANDLGYEVEVIFMSFAPPLLVAIAGQPAFETLENSGQTIRLSALQGLPRPLDSQTQPLDEYPGDMGIDLISVHPDWARQTDLQAYDSRGFELGFWSFNLVPETLASIDAHRPSYITTSQAPTLSSWLEGR